MARINKVCLILLPFFVFCAVSDGLLVTLLCFSGRPNIWWNIPLDHKGFGDIETNLTKAREEQRTYPLDRMPLRLGYRGFVIGIGELVVGTASKKLQLLLLDTIPRDLLPDSYIGGLKQAINMIEPAAISKARAKPKVDDRRKKRFIPQYQPDLWNQWPAIVTNNCYNYATNRMTFTFAQPGRASGNMFAAITPAAVQAAAVGDGLQVILHPELPKNSDSFLVALVVERHVDFHWFVLNEGGLWSHKPGQTPAINFDNSGNPIAHVPLCDMGGYRFVTYMKVTPAVVII